MKTLAWLLLFFIYSTSLFSQENSNLITASTEIPMHHHEGEQVFKEGLTPKFFGDGWNFVDASGKALSTKRYESVRHFENGLAAFQVNEKWGFIDKHGNEVIAPLYHIAFDFTEKNTAVNINDKWHLINQSGKIVTSPAIDKFWGFKNGRAEINVGKQKGIMDVEGNILSLEKAETSVSHSLTALLAKPAAECPSNIDFAMGNFTNWSCYIGRVDTLGPTNVITMNPSPPTINRHTIIQKGTTLDQYGQFPISPPDGSQYAVRLGNNVNGYGAERIRYTVNVPTNATDYSITFQYAVVFQDPGHTQWTQPRFTAKMFDPITNTYLDCATFEYIATSGLPGFMTSPISSTVRYKPWSGVFINLSQYPGRSLILEFTTADCGRGGHWGYAYIDAGNCNRVATIAGQCEEPHITTLTGPGGFQGYNWWDATFTQIIGTGEVLTLNPGPTTASEYWVEVLPFNGYGCRDTLHVSINPNYPKATAGPDISICKTGSTTIGSPAVPGLSYSWSPTTNLSSPNSAITDADPILSTSYVLTVTNDTTGCFAKDTVTVQISPPPLPGFNIPQASQCKSINSFTFTNTTTITSGTLAFEWDFGDNTRSTDISPTHTYAFTGTYVVKLLAISGTGCRDSISKSVTVTSDAIANFAITNSLQCIRGNIFSFTNTSPANQNISVYAWSFGDGNVSSSINPTHTYQVSGTFQVKLIITNSNGCKDSLSKMVTVYANPVITVNNSAPILCKGSTVQLSATGAIDYSWSPAAGLSCVNCPSPLASVDTGSTFIVQGIDANGCYDFDTLTVRVYKPFKIQVKTDSVCLHEKLQLNATGAVLYQWSPAAGLSSTTVSDPFANPTLTTTYKVVGYDSVGCFRDSAEVVVLVQERPVVELGPDVTAQTGSVLTLQSAITNGPITKWMWSPVTNLSCSNCPLPLATVKGDITYIVSVTNRYGCVARDVINIKTFCKTAQVFIPNAFTPDGDGDNDVLMVRGSGITMVKSFRIFNRWGELVFEKVHFPPNTISYGWDGKIKGIVGEPAVYVYTAEVQCENGVIYTYKGNTTILR